MIIPNPQRIKMRIWKYFLFLQQLESRHKTKCQLTNGSPHPTLLFNLNFLQLECSTRYLGSKIPSESPIIDLSAAQLAAPAGKIPRQERIQA